VVRAGHEVWEDFISVNGEIVLRPTTRREAGDALSRRALQLFKQGHPTRSSRGVLTPLTMKEAFNMAMDEDSELKRIYIEG
jgi:hypothetical protein